MKGSLRLSSLPHFIFRLRGGGLPRNNLWVEYMILVLRDSHWDYQITISPFSYILGMGLSLAPWPCTLVVGSPIPWRLAVLVGFWAGFTSAQLFILLNFHSSGADRGVWLGVGVLLDLF